jgi:hypothetical protein
VTSTVAHRHPSLLHQQEFTICLKIGRKITMARKSGELIRGQQVFGTLKTFMTQIMKDQQLSSPDKAIIKKKKAEWEMAKMEARL